VNSGEHSYSAHSVYQIEEEIDMASLTKTEVLLLKYLLAQQVSKSPDIVEKAQEYYATIKQPTVPAMKDTKDSRIWVRVSYAERSRLIDEAAREGLHLSDYIRSKLF
jgi:myo-inositol-hexaphosphate 3-phosphohydrolase